MVGDSKHSEEPPANEISVTAERLQVLQRAAAT
jgi:hypothetical protein